MKITILDDYQNAVRSLACFRLLDGHEVTVWNDHVDDIDLLASRLADTEVLVLIRERSSIGAALLVVGVGVGLEVGSVSGVQPARSAPMVSVATAIVRRVFI